MTRPRSLMLAATLATALACAATPDPGGLSPDEQALVDEIVELYTLRILRFTHPDSAAGLRETIALDVDRADLDARLDRLGRDPKRGKALLNAVHDSLEALRPRLFPIDQG